MLQLPKEQLTEADQQVLRKLRVWIFALAIVCTLTGIGIGALLAGRSAVAQPEGQITRTPEALSASFAEIARRVESAVVNIDTKTAAPEIAEGEDGDEVDGSLLDLLRRQRRRPARGVGSGFIVDPKGLIITNHHVVQGASRISVRLQSGQQHVARIVGVDEETDLAVLKVDAPRELSALKLGDSSSVQVGDWVLAIGSPFGLEQTVTAGIISTKERQPYPGASFQQFLQTDAAINRGNSGGPLVNMSGEVIGINSQIATSTGDYNGIGFALPSNEAAFVYNQIISNGKVRRGYLGIILESVRAEFARVYGLDETKGVIVTDVREPNGPAAKAGVQANDIIVEYNGQTVNAAQDLINKVASTPVGETVSITLLRETGGKLERKNVNVTIGERPRTLAPAATESRNETEAKPLNLRLGLKLQELTAEIATTSNLTGVRGLLVKEVDPDGVAADARPAPVRPGDVIVRINRAPVATLADFQRIVGGLKEGDPIVLHVGRYDRELGRVAYRIVQFTFQ